jgi:hypothetical protein
MPVLGADSTNSSREKRDRRDGVTSLMTPVYMPPHHHRCDRNDVPCDAEREVSRVWGAKSGRSAERWPNPSRELGVNWHYWNRTLNRQKNGSPKASVPEKVAGQGIIFYFGAATTSFKIFSRVALESDGHGSTIKASSTGCASFGASSTELAGIFLWEFKVCSSLVPPTTVFPDQRITVPTERSLVRRFPPQGGVAVGLQLGIRQQPAEWIRSAGCCRSYQHGFQRFIPP